MKLHWDILDEKRRALLPLLKAFETDGFYLAGGTALALHIGHRDSVDFDFFSEKIFRTGALFEHVCKIFAGHSVLKTQEEQGTLSIQIDVDIRVSFFHFPYPLIQPLIATDYFSLASMEDIACMKLKAIVGRTAFKDYVDIYFILQTVPLGDILRLLKKKMPSLDSLLALKSLVYFDDLKIEPITFKTAPVSLEEIKRALVARVEQYPKI